MADTQALIDAYMRKRPDLVRFFTKRTGSPAAAEDIVQDLYVRISTSPAPEDLRSPEAYLYRIGTNLMLDRVKAERRQAVREDHWRRARAGGGPDEVANEPSPEQAVASRQRLAQLMKVLEELPPPVAHAFRRHRIDGVSHGEIAAEMGVSRSSVEKYIMTALRRLMERAGR